MRTPPRYLIWTIGCQMNVADSQRLASELEAIGFRATDQFTEADLVVLNSCVVRQQPEDKVRGRLSWLAHFKRRRPDLIIALMGCLVSPRTVTELRRSYPHVDVFLRPAQWAPLLEYLRERGVCAASHSSSYESVVGSCDETRWQLPEADRGRLVCAYVPIMTGCNLVCSYCIVPARRGRERSRPADEVEAQVRSLVAQGVREVTLLGQIVDRYGFDRREPDALERLLARLDRVPGLRRIRFLTSHPRFFRPGLLRAVAELEHVMEHIQVPVQSGDDEILARMRRGYTADDYRRLVDAIRQQIPAACIQSDVIVGFPGESERAFQATYDLLAELRLDKVHIARYSPRPGTLAALQWADDVPAAEKERRRRALDELQASIATQLNQRLVGQEVEVLVEARDGARWRGRTRGDKLVFFESSRPLLGQVVRVVITWAGPWSLIGRLSMDGEPGEETESPPMFQTVQPNSLETDVASLRRPMDASS